MPRVSCPKCKLSFTIKDAGRKSAECPDCGARWVLDGSSPPSRSRKREDDAPPPKKKGGAGLLIAGVLAFLLVGGGAAAAGVYFFVIKKKKDDPVPVAEEKPPEKDKDPEKKEPVKKLKIGPSAKLEGSDIYKLLLPATVTIITDEGKGRISIGSGVLVCRDPNLIVTNKHVVGNHAMVTVFFPEFSENGKANSDFAYYLENEGKIGIRGKVLERDPTKDCAVVQLDRVPENAQAVPLAKASANEFDRVYGIGASSSKYDTLWQGHEGSVRKVFPSDSRLSKKIGLNCRLLITQQPTYHGDSGGPIVGQTLELFGIVQGGMPADKEYPDYREGAAVNVDIEEIRDVINRAWRLNFVGTFPDAPPLHEPGITPTPDDEKNYTAADYVQILREGDPTQARTAVDRLVNLGAQSVPPLKNMLEDPKASGRWPQALLALEKIGEPAADAMESAVKTLNSEDANVRIAAVKYLGAMGQPARRHVPAMIQAGRGDNASVRLACEKAIIRLGPYGTNDRDMILGKGEDKDPSVIGLRARLLVEMEINQDEKVKLMDPYFKHSSPVVRADATRAVCKKDKFPRPEVYRLVIPFLGDKDNMVRATASDSLNNIGKVEVSDLDALKPFFTSEVNEVHRYLLIRVRPLGERAAQIVPELSKSLKFPDDEVKAEAMETALAISQNLKSLTKEFIQLSKHEKATFRVKAISCLDMIGKSEPGVLAALFERLSDDGTVTSVPRNTQQALLKTFAGIDDRRRAFKDLRPYDKTKEVPVWTCALRLLDQLSPYKTEAQIKEIAPYLKRDAERSVLSQFNAANEIAISGQAARFAMNELIDTLSDPKTTEVDTKEMICAAIGHCGPDAAGAAKVLADHAVIQLVEDKARGANDPKRILNQRVRNAAVTALGRIGSGAKDAMPSLILLADPTLDTGTQDEVIKTFGNIGPSAKEAVPNIMELMQTARLEQRKLIVDTMKKIGPDALPAMADFIPKYETQWRGNVGPYKLHMAKAMCCIECLIAVGPDKLPGAKQKTLLGDLKALRALAVNKRQKPLESLCAEAIEKLAAKK